MSVAPRYFLVDDFLPHRPTNDAERAKAYELSYTPYCIICVFRLGLPASASRSKLSTGLGGRSLGVSDEPADGVRLRGNPLIITDDILSATVQTSKGSYVHQLQFSLSKSPINYLSAILPGDWVMCWMVSSREKGLDLQARLLQLEPCNGFYDGLKFVGRISGVSRDRSSSGMGLNRVNYSVTAGGFSELSSQVFYDPYLAEATPQMGTWCARIGIAISDLLGRPLDTTGRFKALDINKLIPQFLDLLVGRGIGDRFVQPSKDAPELQIAFGLTRRDSGEAPYALTVPGEVGLVLSKRNSSRGTVLAYADILEMLSGVQKFTTVAGQNASPSAPWSIFTPDGIEVEYPPAGNTFVDAPTRKATSIPMIGEFIPMIPDFTGKEIWTILRQWLNPVINEMYTVLKTNEFGQVVPTLVVRQIPLSSQVVADRLRDEENLTVTPLLELPRWVAHPAIVRQDSLARSDSLRFNFVHVYGQSPVNQQAVRFTDQIIRNPPIRNDLDCQRSGLRPYMASVGCSEQESVFGAKTWMAICADWLVDQHLVLGGSVDMELIEAPIVHGDAFEFDGVVSQIEGVVHHFEVVGGQTRATTRLTLTHGVRSDDDPAYQQRDGSDSYIFTGLREEDCQAYDPGVFVEKDRPAVRYENSPTEASLPE